MRFLKLILLAAVLLVDCRRRGRMVTGRPRSRPDDHDQLATEIRRPLDAALGNSRGRHAGHGARNHDRAGRPVDAGHPDRRWIRPAPGRWRSAAPSASRRSPRWPMDRRGSIVTARREVFFGLRQTVDHADARRRSAPRPAAGRGGLDASLHQPRRRRVRDPARHSGRCRGRRPGRRRPLSLLSGLGGRPLRSGVARRILRASPRSGPQHAHLRLRARCRRQ